MGDIMEYIDYGRTDELRNRRINIITLHERGLKPREIGNSLKLDMDTVFNDLKWAKHKLDREDRETLWDKHFMKTIEAKIKETTDPKQLSNYIGMLKLLLQHRQDMRKRHGLYIEKIEHSGKIDTEVKIDIDERLKEYADTFSKLTEKRT